MAVLRRCCLGLLLAHGAASLVVTPAAATDKALPVQALRAKMAKLLKMPGLPTTLVSEARAVDADAAEGGASAAKAQEEFKAFAAHLIAYEKQVREASEQAAAAAAKSSTPAPAAADDVAAHAAELEPVLEARVRRVLAHIKADTGLSAKDDADRKQAAEGLEASLASLASDTMLGRVLSMHDALDNCHGYLVRRAARLGEEQAALTADIEKGETTMLYRMLRQRRTLPMQSQVALLKRPQWANCTYAQQLIKSHGDDKPLYSQLEAMLPAPLAMAAKATIHSVNVQGSGDRLAAHGSGGQVHIISSRLKNAVQEMAQRLEQGRERLAEVANGAGGAGVSKHEREQVKSILGKLDPMLARVNGTHDLSSQLAVLDEVSGNLSIWMKNITA